MQGQACEGMARRHKDVGISGAGSPHSGEVNVRVGVVVDEAAPVGVEGGLREKHLEGNKLMEASAALRPTLRFEPPSDELDALPGGWSMRMPPAMC